MKGRSIDFRFIRFKFVAFYRISWGATRVFQPVAARGNSLYSATKVVAAVNYGNFPRNEASRIKVAYRNLKLLVSFNFVSILS